MTLRRKKVDACQYDTHDTNTIAPLPMNRTIHQMRTISPRAVVRVDRGDIARQIRNRAPSTPITPFVPSTHRTVIIHMHDRRSRAPPGVALLEFHVVILASISRRVRAAPIWHFAGTDGNEASVFAGARAATVATEGEFAGDFRGEMAEEVWHGDEAAADDAGCDLGDTVIAWSAHGIQQAQATLSSRPQCHRKQIISLVGTSGAGNTCNKVHDA